MIERGLIYLAQLRTANGGKLKTNSLMSKSDKLNQRGAAASRSECVQKTLDSERRLIDDRIQQEEAEWFEKLIDGSSSSAIDYAKKSGDYDEANVNRSDMHHVFGSRLKRQCTVRE